MHLKIAESPLNWGFFPMRNNKNILGKKMVAQKVKIVIFLE